MPDVTIARYVLDQIFFNLVSSVDTTDTVRIALDAAIGTGSERNHVVRLTGRMADLLFQVRTSAPDPLRGVARAVRDYVTERDRMSLHEIAERLRRKQMMSGECPRCGQPAILNCVCGWAK